MTSYESSSTISAVLQQVAHLYNRRQPTTTNCQQTRQQASIILDTYCSPESDWIGSDCAVFYVPANTV